MNSKQKYLIFAAVTLIAVTVIIWLSGGGEFFTKTQILVEKEVTEIDRMLGIPPQKEYQDKFVFGLIPPGLTATAEFISVSTVSGLIAGISVLFFFIFKSKKIKETL